MHTSLHWSLTVSKSLFNKPDLKNDVFVEGWKEKRLICHYQKYDLFVTIILKCKNNIKDVPTILLILLLHCYFGVSSCSPVYLVQNCKRR